MYIPAHFEVTDRQAIEALVEAFPLGILVAQTQAGLIANHIPMILAGEALIGHIARANDLHRLVHEGSAVLAIFRGGDAYVSPNWYPSKAVHHRHVPTWNYEVVHIEGTIRFAHDEKTKRAVVGRLTRRQETALNGQAAWRMADAPADYMATMLAAIVAFEITATRILGKAKLSQNREAEDFERVRAVMDEQGRPALARRMEAVRQRDPEAG